MADFSGLLQCHELCRRLIEKLRSIIKYSEQSPLQFCAGRFGWSLILERVRTCITQFVTSVAPIAVLPKYCSNKGTVTPNVLGLLQNHNCGNLVPHWYRGSVNTINTYFTLCYEINIRQTTQLPQRLSSNLRHKHLLYHCKLNMKWLIAVYWHFQNKQSMLCLQEVYGS